MTQVTQVYEGSDGDATKAMYDCLARLGPVGAIAVNLFRAQKSSARAKVYRGGIRGKGSYRGMAYERKQWAMDNLAKILAQHGKECGVRWGWGVDDVQEFHKIVLYVDLPTGQVSFHTDSRGAGPDYPDAWDGVKHQSATRICQWVAQILARAKVAA